MPEAQGTRFCRQRVLVLVPEAQRTRYDAPVTGTLVVRRWAGAPIAPFLDGVYAGHVWRLPPAAVAAAAGLARHHVARELGPGPRTAHTRLGPEDFFARYTSARRQLAADPGNLPAAAAVALGLGFAPEATLLDQVRLRAVPSGGHRVAAAAPAYGPHRDTWYANPCAQVNLWVALDEVASEEALAFHPSHWDQPIANDSHLFDLARWHAAGGWQAPAPGRHFPHALASPRGEVVQLACARGEGLAFSATHLHGTRGHDSGRTRWSAELRVVHLPDVERVATVRRLDDRSRGSTLPEMVLLADVLG